MATAPSTDTSHARPLPDAGALPAAGGRLAEAGALVAALGVSEVVSDWLWPTVGIGLHAALVAFLLWRGAVAPDRRQGRFYLAAAILPLVRILSLAISPHWLGGIRFELATEGLVLVAGLSVAHALGLPRRAFGLALPRHWWLAPLTVASGLLVGWLDARILQAAPLAAGPAFAQWWLPGLLLLCAGFAAEVTFRGVVQPLAVEWLGPAAGIAFTALSWGLLYAGWHAPRAMALACVVGAAWGWARQRDGSVLGAGLAHGLANVLLFVVLPFGG